MKLRTALSVLPAAFVFLGGNTPAGSAPTGAEKAPSANAAADWPMHRGGPQLQGRTEMAAPAKADLAWTYAAGKPIKAAAAIAGGRVFFGDDDGIVHAVDFFTGKALWKFKTEASIEAAPLVLNDTVFL